MKLLLFVFLVRLIILLIGETSRQENVKRKGGKMFKKIFARKSKHMMAVFRDHYIESKLLYVMEFRKIPLVKFIGDIDSTKAFQYVKGQFACEIHAYYQHSFYDHEAADLFFNDTIVLLTNKRIIEITSGYCQVLHSADRHEWAVSVVKELAAFRAVTEKGPAKVMGFARQTTLN